MTNHWCPQDLDHLGYWIDTLRTPIHQFQCNWSSSILLYALSPFLIHVLYMYTVHVGLLHLWEGGSWNSGYSGSMHVMPQVQLQDGLPCHMVQFIFMQKTHTQSWLLYMYSIMHMCYYIVTVVLAYYACVQKCFVCIHWPTHVSTMYSTCTVYCTCTYCMYSVYTVHTLYDICKPIHFYLHPSNLQHWEASLSEL